MTDQRIRHLIVAIPARNERRHIAASLDAVLLTLGSLPDDVSVRVIVACDSCDDDTAIVARAVAASDDRVLVIEHAWGSAGSARAAAVDHGLAAVDDPMKCVWIATTDADTAPAANWLERHMHYASLGFDALAGIVELIDDADRTEPVHATFLRTYTFTDTHLHVHGANLGVRANAYLAAGGFPPIAVAEDHALWNIIASLGHRRISPVDVVVATSARLVGRAAGGFADALASLQAAPVKSEIPA